MYIILEGLKMLAFSFSIKGLVINLIHVASVVSRTEISLRMFTIKCLNHAPIQMESFRLFVMLL